MHFLVAVVSEELGQEAGILEPYSNSTADFNDTPDHEGYDFEPMNDEFEKEYQTKKMEVFVLEGGVFLSEEDDFFKIVMPDNIPLSEYEASGRTLQIRQWIEEKFPEKVKKKKVKCSQVYENINLYLQKERGLDYSEEFDQCGWWSKLNTQWDYFEVGGRWNRELLIKEDVDDYVIGIPLINTLGMPKLPKDDPDEKPAPDGYRWVDGARLKDIEWEKMAEVKREEAVENWEKYQEMVKNSPKDAPIVLNEGYRLGIENNETKDEYIKKMSTLKVYSYVDENGDWKDIDDIDIYEAFLKDLDPEYCLTLIDCHN